MSYQPDTTQRSIIAEARKRLAGIVTNETIIRVPVQQGPSIWPQCYPPPEWDKDGYIVTFEKIDDQWEAIRVD